jgi:hypothetical protein
LTDPQWTLLRHLSEVPGQLGRKFGPDLGKVVNGMLYAGGHSLLSIMKVRLANLEYLIEMNDLHDELGYVRVEPSPIRVGTQPQPIRRKGEAVTGTGEQLVLELTS